MLSSKTTAQTSIPHRCIPAISLFQDHLLYLAMICTKPILQWASRMASATVAGKYVMQLQSFDIMDACSLNPTTLCFWHNLAPSLQCIPEEQFTVSMMLNVEYLPPTHPPSHFYGRCCTHAPSLKQVRGSSVARKTCWIKCTRGAFSPIAVDMPLSKTWMPNCSSRSCSTAISRSSL